MFEKKNFYDLMLSMPIASTSLFNTLNPVYNNQNNPGKPAHLLCLQEFLYYHTHLLLSSPLAIGFHRQSPQYKNPKTLNDTLNDLNSEVIKPGNSREHFFSIFLNIKETIKKISFNQPQYGLILFKLKFRNNSAIVCFLVWLASLTCDRFVNVKSGEPAAVFVFLPEIKVVELNLPESAAAGLPGGLMREVGKMIVIGWNDDELINGSLDGWGNGGMGEWMNKCMVAWSLVIFLIVNCQLLIVNF